MSETSNLTRNIPILVVYAKSVSAGIRLTEDRLGYYLDAEDTRTGEVFKGLTYLRVFPNLENLPDWLLVGLLIYRHDGELWASGTYHQDSPIGEDGEASMTIRLKLSRLDEWERICIERTS